jgi:glucose/arabinose dehydrogenase
MKQWLSMLVAVCFLHTLTAQISLNLRLVAGGFTRPVDIAHTGDDRLFIVEQRGFIKIINATGQVLPTPFLDIDARVNSGANERGLLGLAFHPDYSNNGYFFVNYTNNSGHTVIARYSVNPANPNLALVDSELIIMTITQPFSNHNGGDLNFGADGYLYIGMGDGGSGGDPQNYSQNRQSLLGKMLRIDVDNGSPYSVPPSNPFVNIAGTRPEIWAIGLRNPWRFSFDRETQDLWIADVGQNAWEEVHFRPASLAGGENYGWRCYEGSATYNTNGCTGASGYIAPIRTYPNPAEGCSVTGGFVYRGEDYPGLWGRYLYTDYCSGRIWSLRPNGQGGWINELLLQGATNQYSTFGEDQSGELYLASLGSGQIWQLTDRCAQLDISAQVSPETCPGSLDGIIDLNMLGGQPPFQFAWSNNTTADSLNIYLGPGSYSLTVTDALGCRLERSFVVPPSQVAPPPAIAAEGNLLSIPDTFDSYQWYLNDQPIQGATAANWLATASGSYFVRAVTATGCALNSPSFELIISNILEAMRLREFQLSPNPFQEALTLHIGTDTPATYQWTLLNVQGETLKNGRLEAGQQERHTLPLEDLPAGVYVLRLSRNQLSLSAQVVKL